MGTRINEGGMSDDGRDDTEAEQGMSIASRPGDDPGVLPFSPNLLALTVDHIESTRGPVTIITRSFDRPDMCRLCPRGKCNDNGRFCQVRAERFVPDELCPGYRVALAVPEG